MFKYCACYVPGAGLRLCEYSSGTLRPPVSGMGKWGTRSVHVSLTASWVSGYLCLLSPLLSSHDLGLDSRPWFWPVRMSDGHAAFHLPIRLPLPSPSLPPLPPPPSNAIPAVPMGMTPLTPVPHHLYPHVFCHVTSQLPCPKGTQSISPPLKFEVIHVIALVIKVR